MPLRLLLLLALAVGACKREPATQIARPLLWKIERGGVTSYAFATMHQGVDPAVLPPIVWTTLGSARAFAMETDVSRAAQVPVARSDGRTLHDELGPAYWHKLEAALGHDEATRIDTMKPMIAATLLSLRGLPATPPIDGALLARARAENKPVIYLERIEDELAALDRWYDARAVRAMLDALPAQEQQARDMLAAYVAGDEAAVLDITLRDTLGADTLEDLLYRRNASWIAAIEQMHADGGGFLAIGAAHLVGPRSVLALLAERGYRITRIR